MLLIRWRDLKQQFDLKSQELKHLEEKLKQTSHGQQLEDIKTLQEEIGGETAGIFAELFVAYLISLVKKFKI